MSSAPGVHNGRLAPCPRSPNCVGSDEADAHAIAPLRIKVPAPEAWSALRKLLARTPRVTIVTAGEDYLHAEFVTAILRFTDDVEFHLRARDGVIAVRSASRVGYSDLGANRSRIERLRGELRSAGVVE